MREQSRRILAYKLDIYLHVPGLFQITEMMNLKNHIATAIDKMKKIKYFLILN